MNIIIPIGGLGERFKNNGYHLPKPLIKINGTSMINMVLNNLILEPDDRVFIIYNKELNNFNFRNEITVKNIYFYELSCYTQGAVETILQFIENVCTKIKKTVIMDCDTYYTIDILSKCRESKTNSVVCFVDYGDNPIYSYVKIQKNSITDILEKNKISIYANTGCYLFNDIEIIYKYFSKVIEKNFRFNNEYYISCGIKLMLDDCIPFEPIIIHKDDFECIGTPNQLKICAIKTKSEPKRFCFDLDNTLVTLDGKIIEKNVNYLRYLKANGHYIILYTARRMRTHKDSLGKVMKDIGQNTFEFLSKHDIYYDEIYFGKPYADFYIDDKAVNAYDDIEKETGFYINDIKERPINTIQTKTIDVIIKKGELNKIKGEIYYYKNIPDILKHLFPVFIKDNNDSYIIEKIIGINMSYLFVKENLSEDTFSEILTSIHKLHSYSCNYSKENIYTHYIHRLKSRIDHPIYKYIHNLEYFIDYFTLFLEDYMKYDKAIPGIIHGDPVFSNILFDKNIKFIDMRGIINDEYTIYGDVMYDYAKIYQSLIGYDEVMHDTFVSSKYKNKLMCILQNHIKNNYGEEYIEYVKIISYMHIFTLLPLHEHDKSMKYIRLITF